jgi:hypothetical protein
MDAPTHKSEYVHHTDESALSGYLYKKTRDNRWQKRWFETNGVYLTYYKSRKMEKLLAALSLPQVGDIRQIAEDNNEKMAGLFTLDLNSRIYTLRAKTNDEASLWVSTLNKLRVEGIQASTQPGVNSEASIGKTNSANETSLEENSDWIKSGKSCCGCC